MPAVASQTRVPITTTISAANLPYFFIAALLKPQYTLKGLRDNRTFLTYYVVILDVPSIGGNGGRNQDAKAGSRTTMVRVFAQNKEDPCFLRPFEVPPP